MVDFKQELELVNKVGYLNKTVEVGDGEQITRGTKVNILAKGVNEIWLTEEFFVIYDALNMEACTVDASYVDVIEQ